MDIDLVCCWVRLDEEYEAALEQHVGKVGATPGAHIARFRELGELSFSIPMALQNLPWLRKVFIVTNGQRPPEDILALPKVEWVTHADIIPEKYLPTFNYHAIMPFLSKIPGLADRFISTSDDFFIAKPLKIDDFLGETGDGVFYHTRQSLDLDPAAGNVWQHNLKNSHDVLTRHFGNHARFVFPHAPQLFHRDAWDRSLERFAQEVDETASNKVRSEKSTIFRILHTYDYMYERWGACNYRRLIENSKKDVRFATKESIQTIALIRHDAAFIARLEDLAENTPTFFCLNDAVRPDQFDAVKAEIQEFLKGFS